MVHRCLYQKSRKFGCQSSCIAGSCIYLTIQPFITGQHRETNNQGTSTKYDKQSYIIELHYVLEVSPCPRPAPGLRAVCRSAGSQPGIFEWSCRTASSYDLQQTIEQKTGDKFRFEGLYLIGTQENNRDKIAAQSSALFQPITVEQCATLVPEQRRNSFALSQHRCFAKSHWRYGSVYCLPRWKRPWCCYAVGVGGGEGDPARVRLVCFMTAYGCSGDWEPAGGTPLWSGPHWSASS